MTGEPGMVLVTGASGQVGRAVTAAGEARGLHLAPLSRAELDVTDAPAVRSRIGRERPSVVIHCAAWTDVDGAEENPALARAVNVDGTRAVADAARDVGAHMIYLSTDYVFNGRSNRPYLPSASPAPLSVYGRTKLEGEEACRAAGRWTVVRTSWVFGDPESGFAAVVRRFAEQGKALTVVEDERSRPTWAPVLAEALLDLAELGAEGVHHVACGGEGTRVDLARAILGELGVEVPLRPIGAEEWGAAARRPGYSVLDLVKTERVLGREFMDWREAVREWIR